MLRSSRTGPAKIGSLSRATAVIVGALVALFGVIAGPLLALSTAAQAATTGASAYTAITPFRALGSATTGVAVAAGATTNVQITGTQVPSGATAAVLNVTAQNPSAAGYLTVYPEGGTQPGTSNVNFVAGQTVANLATVPLSATGGVTVYNNTGTTAVDVDVEGYYTASSAPTGSGLYNPVNPNRVFGGATTGTAIGAGVTTSAVVVGGTTGVPATATAVVVNLTAAGGSAASYLTAYPAGATPNVTSNLNFVAGQTIANRDIVDVGVGGAIDLFNFAGSVNVDVDVDGYYSGSGGTGSAFVPLAAPVRLTDTRTPTNGTPIASGGTETFALDTTASGIPSTASSVAANFTVVPGAAPGYVTVYPTGVAFPPTASDVNWAANEGPVANYTQADTAGTTGGSAQVFNLNSGSTVNLVIDAFGYFTPTTSTVTNTGAVTIAIPSTTVNEVSTPSIPADTVGITASVVDGTGGPIVSGDPTLFTVTPAGGTACGTLTGGLQTETVATAAGTGIATIIYTPPTYIVGTTASTCTITAKDGDYGQTGTAVIEQTEPPNTQALTPAAASLPANGSATDLLTDVVTSPVTVPGEADSDAVTFSELGTCGTLSSSGGNTTPADVAVTTTYTASSTPGFCEIIATELNSGVVTMASLDQTQSPTPTPGTVTWSPAAGSQTVGTSVAYTVTVKDHLGDVVVGDPVAFSVTTVPPAGETCGTLSTPITSTGSSGIATVIYTASSATLTTVPDASCTVIGAEADSTAFAALTILQNPVPPVVTLTQALPGNNDPLGVADAISLSMSNVAFATDNGDAIAWTVTSISGICGTVSGASTTLTVASGATTGTAAASYTAPSNSGFCTITATVTRPGPVLVPGSTTVDQT